MKHLLQLAIGILCIVGICGCSSLDYVEGTKVSNDKVALFTKGQTTKDEVVDELGGPQDIKLEGGKQILVYKYQKITAMPFVPNEGSETIFIFNDRGILEDILKSQGSSLSNPLTGR